jgi:nicotinate-nucleotide adenylyltransferase
MAVHGQPARIGVFGGTFDPPQNGHIAVAKAVFDQLHLDLVLFVPAGDPWQKHESSSAADRVDMVKLAIADIDDFSVSTVDIDREGPTYTVDTLRDIAAHFPHSQLYFIMGDDAFAGITTWKDFDKLGELATLVVVSRHGNAPEVPATLSPSVNLLEISTLPISSTMCRERIANGDSLEGIVPDKVAEYVAKHQLYRRNA